MIRVVNLSIQSQFRHLILYVPAGILVIQYFMTQKSPKKYSNVLCFHYLDNKIVLLGSPSTESLLRGEDWSNRYVYFDIAGHHLGPRCMSKKSCIFLYMDLICKNGQDFLNTSYNVISKTLEVVTVPLYSYLDPYYLHIHWLIWRQEIMCI